MRRIVLSLMFAAVFFAHLNARAFAANDSFVTIEPVGHSIPEPLTTTPGDPQRGLAVALDRRRGHCLLCHAVSSLDAPSQGNIGPLLDDVGSRLSSAELRLRLVDGTLINPTTAMPAYYRLRELYRVAPDYKDKTVLSAQEIEDVIAWLATLGGGHAN